jgi:hypothetical protein
VLGALTVQGTGGWGVYKQQSVWINKVSGLKDIYITFSGGPGIANVDWFKFS